VDYEKIAAAAVQATKPADLNRFLINCALVSDLYCPGYNPRQPLDKNSNLARTGSAVQSRFRKDRHRGKGGVVEGQSERRWPTSPEAQNIEIVTSQAVVAKQ